MTYEQAERLRNMQGPSKTGLKEADINVYLPLQTERQASCFHSYHDSTDHCLLRDSLNQMLPLFTDIDFLAGGLLYPNVLHEMLMVKKKRLSVLEYAAMAQRILGTVSLSPWLFYGVPIASAGKIDSTGCVLKVTDLRGAVMFKPVYKEELRNGHSLHNTFDRIKSMIKAFNATIATMHAGKAAAVAHYQQLG
jgi:hypothetical protein